MQISVGKPVKKISAGDKKLSAENFNRMVDICNTVRNWSFGGDVWEGVSAENGLGVKLIASSGKSESSNEMYQIKFSGASFTYNPGIWIREGYVNGTRVSDYPVPYYDPVEEEVIDPELEEDCLWIYAVLHDSFGRGGISGSCFASFDFDDFDTTYQGVKILVRKYCADRGGGYNLDGDIFKQWKLIATVKYRYGEVEDYTQHHLGPIYDSNPVYSYTNDSFRLAISYGLIDDFQDYFRDLDPTLHFCRGVCTRRGNHIVFEETDYTDIDDGIWCASLGPDYSSAWNYDPSLVPEDWEFQKETEFTDDESIEYSYRRLRLAQVQMYSYDDQGFFGLRIIWTGGQWRDDWVRPDGQVEGKVAFDYKEDIVRSIDFVATGLHSGEMQLYGVREKVIDAGLATEDGDFIVPILHYGVIINGILEMYYYRLDSSNCDVYDTCCSLETSREVIQVSGFDTGTPYIEVTSTVGALDGLLFLVRQDGGEEDCTRMAYVDFSSTQFGLTCDDIKDDCITCTYVKECLDGFTCDDWEDWLSECSIPSEKFNHSELTDIAAGTCGDHHFYDYPTPQSGNFSYLANTGDYVRNKMDGGLGDSDGHASVDVNGRGLYTDNSDESVDWFERHLLTTGNVVVDWSECLLNTTGGELRVSWSDCRLVVGGDESIDWNAGEFSNKDWTFLGTTYVVIIEGTEACTSPGSTGALQVAGGIAAGAQSIFYVSDTFYVDILDTTTALQGVSGSFGFQLAIANTMAAFFSTTAGNVEILAGDSGGHGNIIGVWSNSKLIATNNGFAADNGNGLEVGQTVDDWFTFGLLTGNPSAISAGDLLPSDKILVLR